MAEHTTDTGRALKLWVVLARAHGAVEQQARADIARHGLSEGEFAVLEALFHKGPLLLGEVKRKILASSGGVTFLVDRLERKGLAERRRCPEDRRAIYAALTPAGEELMGRIFPEHAAAIVEAVSGLTASEQATAIALLKKLGLSAAACAGRDASPGEGAAAGVGPGEGAAAEEEVGPSEGAQAAAGAG